MKGDFSRQTFSPEKHYSSVRLQQGRAHLDADWNEQVDIEAYRDAATARDVIGPVGSPFDGGGFALSGGSFLRGIDLLDADQGWAVGERAAILRTTDKGASWALQPAPANVGHLNGVQAVAANSAWAVGDGGTLVRFDGSGWTRVTVANVSASLHARRRLRRDPRMGGWRRRHRPVLGRGELEQPQGAAADCLASGRALRRPRRRAGSWETAARS